VNGKSLSPLWMLGRHFDHRSRLRGFATLIYPPVREQADFTVVGAVVGVGAAARLGVSAPRGGASHGRAGRRLVLCGGRDARRLCITSVLCARHTRMVCGLHLASDFRRFSACLRCRRSLEQHLVWQHRVHGQPDSTALELRARWNPAAWLKRRHCAQQLDSPA